MSKQHAERLFYREAELATFRAEVGLTTSIERRIAWSVLIYPRKDTTPRSKYRFIWIVWRAGKIVDGGVIMARRYENACMIAVSKLLKIKGQKK